MFGSTGGLFSNSEKSFIEKKSDIEIYSASIKTDLGVYELNLYLKHDKLIITCESKIEFLSIYSYSKEMTLEELKKLSNSFKSCENIQQGFTTFINILNGISFKINNEEYKSEKKFQFSNDDSLTMRITVPLIYEEYENIEINFEKKEKKDAFEHFKILRSKYLKVKDIISNHSCGTPLFGNSIRESLSTQLEKIEDGNKEKNSDLFTKLKSEKSEHEDFGIKISETKTGNLFNNY